MNQDENEDTGKHGLADKISGLGQKIIGEIETIGGVLTIGLHAEIVIGVRLAFIGTEQPAAVW